MAEKLCPKDYRFILICCVVCALSLLVGIRYFYRAFPEASIHFQVNKATSQPLAERFLAAQGLTTDGYQHASAFRYDNETKVYIERELGLEKANTLMAGRVKIWRWGHRWFKPLQKEELRVDVTPAGEVAAFAHVLPEEAPGQDLSPEAARAMAESFLVLELKHPVDSLQFLDRQTEKRPHRTDHVFNWKVPGIDLREASYRVSVTVQGDRIDGYAETVWIPENWSRGYARLRSHNESTTQIDLLFFALLGIAMLATLGRRLRLKDVPWKTALIFGAITSILQFCSTLNEFPLAEFNFDTTGSYTNFVSMSLLSAFVGALAFGGIIFLLTACAEPIYRNSYPTHLSLPRMLSWRSLRTHSFFMASLVGITLTFFFFAYEIGFYLLANKLGAWAPAEIPYTDLLNTRFPWIFVLLGGFFPAVSEEWMFRAFAIPYFQKLMRYRWVAIVLASFIWGFGHANYPNQPFFIRGIEVGIVGLILSWAMIRYGIMSTLIAHYSIDAFYSAFLFLRSGNPYLVASGAVTAGIFLIPLLLAAGAYAVTRRFLSGTPVINQALERVAPPQAQASAATPAVLPYTPLARRAIYAAYSILALGALLMVFRPPRFGEELRFRISPSAAASSAKSFLSDLKFDLSGFRAAVQPVVRISPNPFQYIYTAAGMDGLNRMYGSQLIPLAWQTRFYKPLQKEEFRVVSDPTGGRTVAFRHSLAEETPGADLPETRTRPIAASFLESQNYDLSKFDLKESRSEKPKERRDTEFTWEARALTANAVQEARLRVQAGVAGDKISSWSQSIKIPEEWSRQRERRGAYRIVATAIRSAFIIALFTYAGLILVRSMRQGIIRWRLAAAIAAVAMLAEGFSTVNSLPAYFFQYDTTMETQIYAIVGLVGAVMAVIGIGIVSFLSAGLIMACYPAVETLVHKESFGRWRRDAAAASAATLGVFMILQWMEAGIQYHAGPLALAPTPTLPDNIGTYLPLVSCVRDILLSALYFSAVLAFVIHLWTRIATRLWVRSLLAAGLVGSFLPLSAVRLSEVTLELMMSMLLIAAACVLVVFFFRDNYAAYLLSAAVLSTARKSSALMLQGNFLLTLQGSILWGLLALVLVLWWRIPAGTPPRGAAPVDPAPGV